MRRISLRALLHTVLVPALCASLFVPLPARSRHNSNSQQSSPGEFNYYVLALSWAPNFCASHPGSANECGIGHHTAFVVHGLWPQGEQGRPNEPCQHTSPVAQDVVQYALNFYPDAGLVQHEWQCHGVYSGLSPQDYFTAVGRAYQSLRIPPALAALSQDKEISAASLVQQFEQTNSAPPEAFVSTCHDAELVAIEACFTKDLKLRTCAPSLHSCTGALLLRAPR